MIHCGFVYPILRRFRTNGFDMSVLVVIDDGWNLGGSGNRLLRGKSGRRQRFEETVTLKAEISHLVTPLIPGI